jgi:aspartyl-tRNA(Asn)/glutamyl-tRNA(Gln) amidotransferase subunit C
MLDWLFFGALKPIIAAFDHPLTKSVPCTAQTWRLAHISTDCPYWRTSMALERSEVEKIAHLARLGLNESEIPHTTETLNTILGLIDQMQAVDTTGIEPLAHPLEATQRLRADLVTEENHRDAYQAIAPAVENGLYLVPKVIE